MRSSEDSYIVRIYRREQNDACRAVGIIEDVASGVKRNFHTLDELVCLLSRSCRYEKNRTERRASQSGRIRLRLPVLVKGRAEDGKAFSESTTLCDISPGGACLLLKTAVAVETSFSLLIDPGKSDLRVKARVAWIEREAGTFRAGAAFYKRPEEGMPHLRLVRQGVKHDPEIGKKDT